MAQDVFARTAANRRVLADFYEGLDDDQLDTASLCDGWTVRDVLGHLVMSMQMPFRRFLLEVVRDRGRVAVTSRRLAQGAARRPAAELISVLRDRSEDRVSAPGIGPGGPMADACIHLRDAAVPLGLPTTATLPDWRLVLDFLTTGRARAGGFLPRGRIDGLVLRATDQDWVTGSDHDADVTGPSEALALAMTGRVVALNQLGGSGVSVLRSRVTGLS